MDVRDLQMRLLAAERVRRVHQQLSEAQRRQGRLEGVHLAARTLQHELGNRLAVTLGYTQLIAKRTPLPPALQDPALKALWGLQEALDILNRLRQATHLEETDWGPTAGTTLDLTRLGD